VKEILTTVDHEKSYMNPQIEPLISRPQYIYQTEMNLE